MFIVLGAFSCFCVCVCVCVCVCACVRACVCVRARVCVQELLGGAVIKSGAKLEELDLSDNAFGPDGVRAATQLLTSSAGACLTTLKFHNNGLGIGGGKVSDVMQ